MFKRAILAFLITIVASLPVYADDYKNATRLGGSTSFYGKVDSLQDFVSSDNAKNGIKEALVLAGVPEISDKVIATIESGVGGAVLDSCEDAPAEEGVISKCSFPVGSTLEWMAYRPDAKKGIKTPKLLKHLRWAGNKPFKTYVFRVLNGNRVFTFLLPEDCGNLSLASIITIPIIVTEPPPPVVVVEPPPVVVVEPPPPVVVVVEPPPVVKAERSTKFFVEALFGKDRRMRPIDSRKTVGGKTPVAQYGGPDEFAQCSPLVGLKLGVAKKFDNGMEIGTSAGVALSLVDADRKVKENEVFIDAEVNKYYGNAYVGAGVSFWDITRVNDTYTPALLLHLGLPIKPNKVYFVGETRLFADHSFKDLGNNYQFWIGTRVKF